MTLTFSAKPGKGFILLNALECLAHHHLSQVLSRCLLLRMLRDGSRLITNQSAIRFLLIEFCVTWHFCSVANGNKTR
jgi:hypothetical protein